MNEVKVGKLTVIACYTYNFISKLLPGGKYSDFLLNCAKISTDYFVLGVLTVGRFQNRIFVTSTIISTSQEKENKILFIPMKKLEELLLIHDNSKSEEGQGYYKDKT